MNILHITNWYPSTPTTSSAPWIQKHIKALSPHANNIIYHIEVKKGIFKISIGVNSDNSFFFVVQVPFEIWRIYEYLSFLLLIWVLFKNRNKKIDIINFHIAYPNCTYLHLVKRWIKCPVLITEHWSGYHYNFNVKRTEKLRRIRKIFDNQIPILSVSKALAKDIKTFSNNNIKIYVIPNIVNTDVFNYRSDIPNLTGKNFFMVSQWKWPKNPFIVLRAWEILQIKHPDIQLTIGGYGQQWDEMKESVRKNKLENSVKFIGKMNEEEIARQMNQSSALIHISEYETFSVVCAEALCCGTPVIASEVGGIPELINTKNGILVLNNVENLILAVNSLIINKSSFDRESIAENASLKYSFKSVGEKYFRMLKEEIK